jgi:hypothetical protein
MSRFLNKKEEVIDLKLTSYGKYLLSVGTFKPVYYAFYDDNVVYDAQYFGRLEVQNETRKRIKDDTQYLEGLVLFEDVEKNVLGPEAGELNYFEIDISPSRTIPRKDIFRFDQALGDAYLQGGTQTAPAWKVVSMVAPISSSAFMDVKNNSRVPQVNISASYSLRTKDWMEYEVDTYYSTEVEEHDLVTQPFADNKVIYLQTQDPLIYVEEMNTELLMENYDIEVFEYIDSGSAESMDTLRRIYFKKDVPQIIDGIMQYARSPDAYEDLDPINGTGSVGYYFDLLRDAQIDRRAACKAAQQFNRQSYYIDLDFDCSETGEENFFFDIYGRATEPEICLD